jgi:hypothetical protein
LISVLNAAVVAMVGAVTTELQFDPRPSSTPAKALYIGSCDLGQSKC